MSRRSCVRSPQPLAAAQPGVQPAPDADACDVFHIDPARVSALRQVLIADASAEMLAETFRVLGDPTRVRLLDALSHGELCVCDLAMLTGLSESATSHQLRLLRALRLVRPRRAGRMVFYSLDDRHIMSLFQQGLRHVEEHEPARRTAPRRRQA